ncbi:L,D-transpeptidase family protein [Actinoplanes sp. LDG1-06]|uniref:L,D-transpeptidase family protein n=1 Tax=Paractinoplanes ovalisporus TaxID=2810368 RepID=A0ABS2AFZ6_9ACTN|nr:Ig-like domain-containing protein [Actinoplanes ovalisporus]MBM2618744.1 L,D-transpeptidase family protein [Actinoplanes ovalisporus]
MKTWGFKKAAVAVVAASLLLTSACGDGDKKSSSWEGGGQPGSSGGASPAPEALPSTVAVSEPAADAKNVQAISSVKYTSEDPENTEVKVVDAKGAEIEGTLDKDAKTFTPSKTLAYGTKYTVTVTGPEAEGKTNTATSSFTTMAKPSKEIRVTSFMGDGQTVGVGMPLIIRFGRSIPESYRDDVERRMKVTATPVQEGTWHWTSPTEVHYRPKVYWKAQSKVFYKVALKGVPLGDGYYGRSDLTVDLKIGRSFVMTVSNKTKQMTVKQDGKVIKTIPVSLGKKSTPSSSGTMVVIEKKKHTIFDTTDELPAGEGYKTPIDFAQRITWSGQFIHAAPWSEGKQGKVNVSHGCVNVSEAMGAWLFDRTMMGDPITVSGTEEKLKNGNGWTDWNMSWDEYKKGSYL